MKKPGYKLRNFFCRGTVRRKGNLIRRNDPCPCGKVVDGKPVKFKACCNNKIKSELD